MLVRLKAGQVKGVAPKGSGGATRSNPEYRHELELSRFSPDLQNMLGIVRFLGDIPGGTSYSPGERLRTAHRILGLSIKKVAKKGRSRPRNFGRAGKGTSELARESSNTPRKAPPIWTME